MQRQIDDAGEAFIKRDEELRLRPYLDQHGLATIGWGHTKDVTLDMGEITQEEAETFFEEDIAQAERAVNFVTIELNQNEFNALVSLVFNIGSKAFMDSTMFAKLNLGDKRGASKEFARWVYYHDPITKEAMVSNGLRRRRFQEQALFTSGATYADQVVS